MRLSKDKADSPKIVDFPSPFFYLLNNVTTSNSGRSPSWAVFLGNDFKNMSRTIDQTEFIKQTNLCLDYIRRECQGCRPYYKPHPNETDEFTHLDLVGFEIIPKAENEVAEVFFWQHFAEIKYVFSVASTSVWSAYNLGLNAYSFLKCVEGSLGKDIGSARDYFDQLPGAFFIKDYNQPLQENRKILKPDPVSEERLVKDLAGSDDVWFLVGDPGMLVIYVAFVKLIKKHFPDKKINLIMPRHHRWGLIKKDHYENYFNRVITFPRSLYSLKPGKFIKIIKTILAVRNLNVGPKDTFLLFANSNLLENCFLSYFKNKKIAVQFKDYFEINYGLKESEILRDKHLRIRLTTRIFNLFLEPLLGLYRTVYLEYGDGRIINKVRFVTPATKIYDRIYLLS